VHVERRGDSTIYLRPKAQCDYRCTSPTACIIGPRRRRVFMAGGTPQGWRQITYAELYVVAASHLHCSRGFRQAGRHPLRQLDRSCADCGALYAAFPSAVSPAYSCVGTTASSGI
jgi:hypothetical protein